MKSKIVVMIGLTVIFSFFFIVKAEARTFNPSDYSSYFWTLNYSNVPVLYASYTNRYFNVVTDSGKMYLNPTASWTAYYVSSLGSFEYNSYTIGAPIDTYDYQPFIAGTSNFNSNGYSNFFNNVDDYNESLIPSWWDNVKQAFMDFVGSEALSSVLSGDWLSYIDDVLFGELWTVKVGEGEDDMIIPETVSATPTPSPTPIPTPIPYSTVINPNSGEITYHYTIVVSGTPVPTSSIYPPVTSSPPGPGSGSTIDEPVAVEDYYEPEDSLSVPKLRIFKFLLRMTGNDVDVGMDSLDDNMAIMDATLKDNAEAISGVGDLFQLIPVKWFLLIGTLACFPVIAAMIKSLLGG